MHSEIENERFTLHISTSSVVADGISHVQYQVCLDLGLGLCEF